jgi:site-specific DNA-methyltransferase (cytosine-N4-specific)
MLTNPGDLVLDIFAGSNTTGAVAEREGRRWLAFELEADYVAASAFRFIDPESSTERMNDLYGKARRNEQLDLASQGSQLRMFEEPGLYKASRRLG